MEESNFNSSSQISNASNGAGVFIPNQSEGDRRSKRKIGRGQGGALKGIQLIYSGKQVIDRGNEADGTMKAIPSGTNFIGKLLTSIDSRSQGLQARVILPYGINHSQGGSIPRNSTLTGQVTADIESGKIFIRFMKVIFPDGKEYKLDAQALTSSDYSPGLLGVVHSNVDTRMAGSVALTMISAAADVLTQRTMMGGQMPMGIGVSSPEPTTKNALLQGVSQLTKQEAQKQTQSAQNATEYVTLPQDSDLIVSLLSPFIGGPFAQ